MNWRAREDKTVQRSVVKTIHRRISLKDSERFSETFDVIPCKSNLSNERFCRFILPVAEN